MKHSIQRLALPLAAWLLAAAPLASTAAPPHTGIQGQAFLIISYGTPVEIAPGLWIGIPSVQLPTATAFTVRSAHSGRDVARVSTGTNGDFSLALHPGKYVIVPDTLTFNFGCSVPLEPFEVTVRPHEYTLANFFYFWAGPCAVWGG